VCSVRDVLWYAGADVHAADQEGNTALHIAARYGHELLINTLLQHEADILKYLLYCLYTPYPGKKGHSILGITLKSLDTVS